MKNVKACLTNPVLIVIGLLILIVIVISFKDVEYYKKGNRRILRKWNRTMKSMKDAFINRDDNKLRKLNTRLRNMRDELVKTSREITKSMSENENFSHNGVLLGDYLKDFSFVNNTSNNTMYG